jgi:hypothetical protein
MLISIPRGVKLKHVEWNLLPFLIIIQAFLKNFLQIFTHIVQVARLTRPKK